MALGVNGVSQNIFAKPADVVSGTELSQVAQSILSTKTSSAIFSSSNVLNFGKSLDVSLYGANASSNVNSVIMAATNTAGYELSLSQKALSAVSALNAKAANDTVSNIAQFRNGMIHVDNQKPDFTNTKNIFAVADKAQVFEAMNLSKDRKGPSPFYVPRDTKKKIEKEEGLNLIA